MLGSSKEIVFVAKILAAVGLSENCNAGGVQSPRLSCAPGCHAKAQRCVVHAVDHDALVLGAIVRPASNVSLDNVAAVEKGHLAIGSHPDFPSGMLGEDFESGDVQAELSGFCEFA